jgi:hypothetical protein
VVAVAVKLEAAPPVESAIDCVAGAVPPIWKLTGASDAGLTVMVGAFDTVRVTEIVCEVAAPGEVRVTCPV